jgi:asparagine synthase (glutamine-hydrolysing)
MCGLGLIFHYQKRAPVDRAELDRMNACMECRGPDSSGNWVHPGPGHVGFTHRRLAILDLSASGHQPMTRDDPTRVLTYNGEIYNYPELRTQLENDGFVFESDSDTEALLYLYKAYGRAMVDHLRGMFAFAIWDDANQGLFMARDPYGIKPLYYADDGTTFRAASQVKALVETGAVDTAPEPAGHAGFFLWGHVPDPYTMYRGIRAVPAGSTLWVGPDGREDPTTYLTPERILAQSAAHASRNGTAGSGMRDTVREALLDSIDAHLLADVDVGLFLSAGRDSATLLALASERVSDIRCVTLGFREFEGTENDEVPLARALARRYGAQHDVVWISRTDFADAHDALFEAMDQPSIDGVNSFFVSRAAAQSGLKVTLSGLGGDELFGGYPSFNQIPRLVGYVSSIPAYKSIGRGFRDLLHGHLAGWTSPKAAGLLEYGGSVEDAYLLRRGLYMPWELPTVMDPDLAHAGLDALALPERLQATTDRIDTRYRKVAALETAWYMRHQLLRDTDWASMAHSLEVRVPLVDVDLLRALAPHVSEGLGKSVMAETPRRALPDAVLNRPKTGFSVPVRDWMLSHRPDLSARRLRGWATYVYDRYWNGS